MHKYVSMFLDIMIIGFWSSFAVEIYLYMPTGHGPATFAGIYGCLLVVLEAIVRFWKRN